jgi:glycolate oxidase FAD binding subunit
VLGDGTVASSGGRVVKNVAGYDIGRMLCGSLGSLAVVVEAAFTLHPLPAATATVVAGGLSPSALAAAASRVAALPAPVSALDAHWPDGFLVARLEGTRAGVGTGAEAVAAASGGDVLTGAAATDLDVRLRLRPWDGEGLVAGIGAPLSRVAELLEACSDFAAAAVVRAGVGAAEARLPVDAEAVMGFRAAVERIGGHLSLRRGGSLLPGLAWPDGEPVAVELARSVKRSLDPAGTLACGRRQGGV